MKTILSGVKPTGLPHLGNYLGAIRQHIEMQDKYNAYIFVADLHSLTTERDPIALQDQLIEVGLTYLSLGLDPEKAVFFKQSDISAHSELCWILNCVTQMGFLKRAHAWKDSEEKGLRESTVGLFDYPVLMASDILLYSPDLIPVGKDQKQHVEMTRDIAQTFNHTYGETFKLPEAHILKDVETIPGTDGQKMSKSYKNTIEIFAPDSRLKKQVMGIVTDSKGVEDSKDPDECNVFAIYKHLASENEITDMRNKYEKGGFGYGDAKKVLLEKIHDYFKEAREKYDELKPQSDKIRDILNEGTAKAQIVADEKLAEIKEKIGLK